jgi:signal transduction histidine kinase
MVSDTPWEKSQGKRFPLMAGIAGRLAAFGEPLLVKDYPNWPGRLNPDQAADITTAAGVPLKFRGQVIGTLAVLDNRPDKVFDDQDIQLLELLAPQAAISIRNARLYQELQERIDAQQLAESRLIRSARLAAVGEMAAGIAHELNNPLTTVSGFAELILDELPPDDPHHAELALVLQEANRARSVVRRLLDFSRPVEDQRKRTDVNELINQVLALTHHLLHASGVTLTTSLSQDLPWISMDSEQIKQVLVNLVNNAIQSMPTGGKLTIQSSFEMRGEADRLERWVTIAVCDNGVGIQPAIMDRLFEPFFTTRPAGKGTGLGLSVSYGIIASHGGYIDVTSQVGAGSCFTVYLPAALSDIPSYGDHLG